MRPRPSGKASGIYNELWRLPDVILDICMVSPPKDITQFVVLEHNFNLVAVVVFFIISYKNNSKVSHGYTHNLLASMLTS